MKDIIIGIIFLAIGNYAYKMPTYFENKERERFLKKLKSNNCSNKEIGQELKKYSWIINRVIKTYGLIGSHESDLVEFKNEILQLSERANRNSLTISDKSYIENIFNKKLRAVSWFPFLTKKEELNREFLWISK